MMESRLNKRANEAKSTLFWGGGVGNGSILFCPINLLQYKGTDLDQLISQKFK